MEKLFDDMLRLATEINVLLKDDGENKNKSQSIITLFKQKQELLDAASELGKKSNKDNRIFSDISSSKLNKYKLLEEENISLIKKQKTIFADKLKEQVQKKSLLIYTKR